VYAEIRYPSLFLEYLRSIISEAVINSEQNRDAIIMNLISGNLNSVIFITSETNASASHRLSKTNKNPIRNLIIDLFMNN
jgi:hypothetical protein